MNVKSMPASEFLSHFAIAPAPRDNQSIDDTLQNILRAIRQHLGMDAAFLAEFAHGKRCIRYVDAAQPDHPIKAGDADPLEDTHCQRVVDGRLPELLPDAQAHPVAAALPITAQLRIGSHLSVPVRLSDGRIYGTFCCVSQQPDQTLKERDLELVRVFASLAATHIEQNVVAREKRQEIEQRIRSVLDGNGLSIVYQPIYRVGRDGIVGFESLSRFSTVPARSPDVWFNEASSVGLGVDLEIRAIEAALQGLAQLPQSVYLSVNTSPDTILSGALAAVFRDMPLDRLVLELTEHMLIERYDDIGAALEPLRRGGMRIAVDDAGAGYASFRHILNLAPEIIKLDIGLTRNIDSDRSRRALAAAFFRFSEETGSTIVAEGVETEAELAVLQQLGIDKAQGYLLGRPMSVENAVQLCGAGR
jgi:EAL domain-containing protein (putative c-di-GMP-specific phosphodiesterase class I)